MLQVPRSRKPALDGRIDHSFSLYQAVSTHAPLAKAVSPGEKPNDTLIGQSSGLSNHPDKSSDNKSRAASPPVGAPKPGKAVGGATRGNIRTAHA